MHVNSIWKLGTLLQILYFIFPNNPGIPSGKESGGFFSLQNISFGKYLKVLNLISDLLGLCVRGIIIIAQAQPFISFIPKPLSFPRLSVEVCRPETLERANLECWPPGRET